MCIARNYGISVHSDIPRYLSRTVCNRSLICRLYNFRRWLVFILYAMSLFDKHVIFSCWIYHDTSGLEPLNVLSLSTT
uniref:Uncharacterized protein n=1 Tax=Arundo donax TaxID=35708 RepID=A0A0A9GW75_ARUDO